MIDLVKKVSTIFAILIGIYVMSIEILFWISPAEHFFLYEPNNEIEYRGNEGNLLFFHSNMERYQTMEYAWSDTLWCRNVSGYNVQYDSQQWNRTMKKGVNTEQDTWKYTLNDTLVQHEYCELCGVVTARTVPTVFRPDGYPKYASYCSNRFVIE